MPGCDQHGLRGIGPSRCRRLKSTRMRQRSRPRDAAVGHEEKLSYQSPFVDEFQSFGSRRPRPAGLRISIPSDFSTYRANRYLSSKISVVFGLTFAIDRSIRATTNRGPGSLRARAVAERNVSMSDTVTESLIPQPRATTARSVPLDVAVGAPPIDS